MMTHYMGLQTRYFQAIDKGTKDIELRLYDDKRRKIQVGDTIVFTDQTTKQVLEKEVAGLLIFPTFYDLLEEVPTKRVSWPSMRRKEMLEIMEQFYPIEKQLKTHVVGIVLKDLA